ncbi:hypothetical protein QUC31_015876 [Theobroma cacao]
MERGRKKTERVVREREEDGEEERVVKNRGRQEGSGVAGGAAVTSAEIKKKFNEMVKNNATETKHGPRLSLAQRTQNLAAQPV